MEHAPKTGIARGTALASFGGTNRALLSRHTLKNFYFRSGLKTAEDEALQENPKFWDLIEAAKTSAK
ncbi:MAG TPA: hypothetical protein VKU37_06650 [Verrucomicrobiae bacterium]|nr:hypothetical protein [Verrucomicrobiae bacterium]